MRREELLVARSAALPEVSARLRALVEQRARLAVNRRRSVRRAMAVAAACMVMAGLTAWRMALVHSNFVPAGSNTYYPASIVQPAPSRPQVRQAAARNEAGTLRPKPTEAQTNPPRPQAVGGALRSPVLTFLGEDMRQIEEQMTFRRSILEKIINPH